MTRDEAEDVTPEEMADLKRSQTRAQKISNFALQTRIVKRHIARTIKNSNASKSKDRIKKIASASPLLTALIAPLSTLYDIPGLTQHWYVDNNGVGQPDPVPNLVLSALGLALNVTANFLLIFRFSSRIQYWKTAMLTSTTCWVMKTIVAIVNLGIFGIGSSNYKSYALSEGFWCAAFSAGLAALISLVLVFYAIFSEATEDTEDKSLRIQARHFLLTELSFFCVIALEALIMSRLEGWAFFDAVYFAVITATTVGFGSDYAPTTTASRIIIFPFALITIAGLATQVSTVIDFFSSQAQARKVRWRLLYEQKREAENEKLHPTDELLAEMAFLERLAKQETVISNLYDLAISLTSFLLFWFLGAMIFHFLEKWTYGTSLYFCYVFFLTLGYGDFYPHTAVGRVFFVTYALVAVPIIASFAVQTVSQILTAINESRLEKEKVRRGLEPQMSKETTIQIFGDEANDQKGEITVNPFVSHSDLVVRAHERYRVLTGGGSEEATAKKEGVAEDQTLQDLQQSRRNYRGDKPQTEESAAEDANDKEATENSEGLARTGEKKEGIGEEGETGDLIRREQEIDDILNEGDRLPIPTEKNLGDRKLETEMLDEILMYAIRMEEQARKVITSKLESGSKARLLLQADKNVMDRCIKFYRESDDKAQQTANALPIGNGNDLEEIHIYREVFARMLVSATRLKKLQGKEQLLFERRRGSAYRHGFPVEDEKQEK